MEKVLYENDDIIVTYSNGGADGTLIIVTAKGGERNAEIHIEPTYGLSKKDRGLWITIADEGLFLSRSGSGVPEESWPAIHVVATPEPPHISEDPLE